MTPSADDRLREYLDAYVAFRDAPAKGEARKARRLAYLEAREALRRAVAALPGGRHDGPLGGARVDEHGTLRLDAPAWPPFAAAAPGAAGRPGPRRAGARLAPIDPVAVAEAQARVDRTYEAVLAAAKGGGYREALEAHRRAKRGLAALKRGVPAPREVA